jgi:hypothetical protein
MAEKPSSSYSPSILVSLLLLNKNIHLNIILHQYEQQDSKTSNDFRQINFSGFYHYMSNSLDIRVLTLRVRSEINFKLFIYF